MNRLVLPVKPLFRAAAVLVIALALASSAFAGGKSSTLHHVSVGVSQYPNLSANSQLRFAHKDALDLARVWQSQEGQFYARVDGQVLINDQATRSNILAALDRLLEKARAGDTAVVSLSGHGGFGSPRDPEWYFLPHNYVPGSYSDTALAASVLRAKLTELARRGVTVILILDACHSGGFGQGGDGIVVFASCEAHETSLEGPAWTNGVFTRALIEALQGLADLDRNGEITLAEIDAYVSSRVLQLLAQGQNGQAREQHPTCGRPLSVRGSTPLTRVIAATTAPAQAK